MRKKKRKKKKFFHSDKITQNDMAHTCTQDKTNPKLTNNSIEEKKLCKRQKSMNIEHEKKSSLFSILHTYSLIFNFFGLK